MPATVRNRGVATRQPGRRGAAHHQPGKVRARPATRPGPTGTETGPAPAAAAAERRGRAAAALTEPLGLSHIGLGGLSLKGLPVSFVLEHLKDREVKLAASLIECGVLPAQPRAEDEAPSEYIQRMCHAFRRQYQTLEMGAVYQIDGAVNLEGWNHQICTFWSMNHIGAVLAPLGERVLPSLLMQVSQACSEEWPIYTPASMMAYLEGSFAWHGSTLKEVSESFCEWIEEIYEDSVAEDHEFHPENVRQMLGETAFGVFFGEEKHQALSLEELRDVARQEPSGKLPALLSLLTQLSAASTRLGELTPDDWHQERLSSYYGVTAPVAAFGMPSKLAYPIEREVLEDEHQGYLMGEGHTPRLNARLAGPDDFAVLGPVLEAHTQVMNLTLKVVRFLEEWEQEGEGSEGEPASTRPTTTAAQAAD